MVENIAPFERKVICTGGFFIAGIAGFVNVVLLMVHDLPVSHMTGAWSRLGMDLGMGKISDLPFILPILIGFFTGSFASGMIIGESRLQAGRRYGVVMMVCAVLLFIGAMTLADIDQDALDSAAQKSSRAAALCLCAAACGLQNAMATSYRGLVIRTTHVSGMVTDIGVMLGNLLRRREIRQWKFVTLASILLGYLAGAIAGGWCASHIGNRSALLIPAAFSFCGGLGYFVWRKTIFEPSLHNNPVPAFFADDEDDKTDANDRA